MRTEKILVEDVVQQHGNSREKLLPILQEIVKKEKYLKEEAMQKVADLLDMSPAEVYGVASFYSFIDIEPRGENIIRVCQTITCDMAGKEKIIKAIEDKLRIKVGQTTPDNKFTLLHTNCMGWCHEGPAMLINDKVYTQLTTEKAVKALDDFMK